jgi:ComF family protein
MRGPGADLIHGFKYAGARSLAQVLARRSLDAFGKVNPSVPDFIVAVPLHPARLRQRGYNQSQLLAEELTLLTGVITAPGLLVRDRATRAQATLPPERREANVSGAFVVRYPEVLVGKAVTVVDDVATTGATLRACAGPLLDAGASRVTAVVAAIA